MATSFVFSPIPRFHQLASMAWSRTCAQRFNDATVPDQPWPVFPSLPSSSSKQDKAKNQWPESSEWSFTLPAVPQLFSPWLASSDDQRSYTASLRCASDEVFEIPKQQGSGSPTVGVIGAPAKGNASRASRTVSNRANGQSSNGSTAFATKASAEEAYPEWLNSLSKYKLPGVATHPSPTKAITTQERLTPPPGSRSRLARLIGDRTQLNKNSLRSRSNYSESFAVPNFGLNAEKI